MQSLFLASRGKKLEQRGRLSEARNLPGKGKGERTPLWRTCLTKVAPFSRSYLSKNGIKKFATTTFTYKDTHTYRHSTGDTETLWGVSGSHVNKNSKKKTTLVTFINIHKQRHPYTLHSTETQHCSQEFTKTITVPSTNLHFITEPFHTGSPEEEYAKS